MLALLAIKPREFEFLFSRLEIVANTFPTMIAPAEEAERAFRLYTLLILFLRYIKCAGNIKIGAIVDSLFVIYEQDHLLLSLKTLHFVTQTAASIFLYSIASKT